jgi:hypothetical protein
MTRALASALVCIVLVVAPAATGSQAQSPPSVTALRNDRASVKFGVIGDTGTGGQAQYDIATLLHHARERFPFEFVIMLGDNMYGSETPADFVRKFERPYKPLLDAGIRFYATLGNHDDPQQRFYAPFNMNGNRYYTFKKGGVEFFVLDSTYVTPAQVSWLGTALGRSTASWKIAYFHHPLYSSGMRHGPDLALRATVEPLFLKYGISAVFAGHEHFYERVKPQGGIAYFTMGGSARLRKSDINTRSGLTEKGFDTDNSFMLVEILDDRLYFDTISRRGRIVDSGTFTRRAPAATR